MSCMERITMFVLLLWTILASQVCDGLCPTGLPSLVSSSSSSMMMVSSSIGNEHNVQNTGGASDKSGIARSRPRDRKAETLYDYLGASPKDTQEHLKLRYTTLAKTLHPDSNPDSFVKNYYYDLSDINAAWAILKDPEERKRYDRSLQTKEIAEGISSFVAMGIEKFETTAIPWFQKTAVSTAAAVDASTEAAKKVNKRAQNAAKEVNEQAKTVYGVFEIEQQVKTLEKKLHADSLRASKLQKELAALPTKKIATLEKQSQRQQSFCSAEARMIAKRLQTKTIAMRPSPNSLSNDIKLLTETESKHRDAIKVCQSTERASQTAARKVDQAMRVEELAQRRLKEALLAVNEANQNCLAAQEVDKKAKAEERMALQASTKIEGILEKVREKVRVGLLQQQDVFLDRRAKELKKEIEECEKSSKNYLRKRNQLSIKANKFETG